MNNIILHWIIWWFTALVFCYYLLVILNDGKYFPSHWSVKRTLWGSLVCIIGIIYYFQNALKIPQSQWRQSTIWELIILIATFTFVTLYRYRKHKN